MAVPQNVQFTTLSPSSVRVSWDAVPGATFYTTAGSLGNPITTTRTSLQYDGIGAGVPYTFSVSSTTQSAFSDPIKINTLTPQPIKPLVLTGFTVVSPTSVSVQFTGGGGGSLATLVNDVVTQRVVYNGGNATISGLTGGQQTVQLTSTNAGGSVASNVLSVTTGPVSPPTAPTGLASSLVTDTGFVISWTAGTGATSYTFTLNGAAATPVYTFPATSATFSGLTASTQYSVVVTAVNSGGSAPSSALPVTTTASPVSPPTAPTALASSLVTDTGFVVSWTPGTGATSYTFTLNGAAATPTYTFPATSATFSSLTASTLYSVVVIAVNSAGTTPSSALPVTTTAPTPTPPTAPTALAYSLVTDTGFVISWTAGTGATSYTFTLNGAAATPTYFFPNTSATFSGLTASTLYSVVVTAVNSAGTAPSSALPVTTAASPVSPPTAPTALESTNITNTGFFVNWTAGTGATSYTFTLNGIAAVPTYTFPDTSAKFSGLTASTLYSVVVTAVNSAGSTPSSALPVTTAALPPLLNIVTVGFLVPNSTTAFSPNNQWTIDTSGSTQLGNWDLSSGENSEDGATYLSNLQQAGVKVLLSLAGSAIQDYTTVIPTGADANDFISSMCYACLGIDCPNPWEWSRLNGLVFDGFDLDIEGTANPADFTSMTNLATKFRALCGVSKILTCAPQTPNIANNVGQNPVGLTNNSTVYNYNNFFTPVAQINTNGQSLLSAGTFLNNFDYVFLQMYNQDVTLYPPETTFKQLLSQWAYACKVSSTKLVLGVGTTDTGQSPSISASSWQTSQIPDWITVLNEVQAILGPGQISSWCAGFGSYSSGDSTTSPSPSGLDAQAALRVIYTPTTGITNAPALATILYNCASTPPGVPPPDPLWTTLPIPAP